MNGNNIYKKLLDKRFMRMSFENNNKKEIWYRTSMTTEGYDDLEKLINLLGEKSISYWDYEELDNIIFTLEIKEDLSLCNFIIQHQYHNKEKCCGELSIDEFEMLLDNLIDSTYDTKLERWN